MSKRKLPPTQVDPWNRDRLRVTASRRQRYLSQRPNTLFEHLHRDIRNRISKYMVFPPLVNILFFNKYNSRFVATSPQARQEGHDESARQFWIVLQQTKEQHEKETGCTLQLPTQLASKDILIGLKKLTIRLDAPLMYGINARLLQY